MSRALEYLLSQPLLCTPEAAEAAASVVLRESDPEMVEAAKGRKLEGTKGVFSRDGVSVVRVRGGISRYATMMDDVCPTTNVETLATDLKTALDDPSTRSILLEIDSPGGEANGISELAGMVRAANGVKPVCAYVGGQACSAGYWLAASAGEVVCSETATLGSIGCVMGASVKGDRPGVKTYKFVSSQSPLKHADPATDDGRASLQARCDAMAGVFVASVATMRDVTPETVLSDFGRGGVMVGADAVRAGLADATGDFESTLARLSRGERLPRKKAPPKAPPKAARTKGTTMNLASILPAFFKADPEAAAKAVADAAMSSADDTAPPAKRAEFGYMDVTNMPPAKTPEQTREEIRAELEQAQRATMSGFFAEQASDWFDRLVDDGKALPRDKAKVTALYVDCALSDRLSGPLGFEAVKGSPETVSRLSVLAATFAAAKDNGKTAEHVHDTDGAVNQRLSGFKVLPEADGSAGKGKADAETVLSLLEATPTGRAILAERARAGK